MKLSETAEMMVSENYKERFKAEYYQLENRLNGLRAMTEKWNKGELNFTPTCERDIYNDQIICMSGYLSVLKVRAEIEKIEL